MRRLSACSMVGCALAALSSGELLLQPRSRCAFAHGAPRERRTIGVLQRRKQYCCVPYAACRLHGLAGHGLVPC
eukprot:2346690-Alexandrium_andersonii.AAC.1